MSVKGVKKVREKKKGIKPRLGGLSLGSVFGSFKLRVGQWLHQEDTRDLLLSVKSNYLKAFVHRVTDLLKNF